MSLQTGIIVHIDLRNKEEHKNHGSFRDNHISKYYSYLAPVTGWETISCICEAIKTQIFNNCTVMVIHIQGTQNSIILTGYPTYADQEMLKHYHASWPVCKPVKDTICVQK